MSRCVSTWVNLVRDSLHFLDLTISLTSHVGEVFNYNFFKNFLSAFLFFFFLWDPCNLNIGAFNIVPKVSAEKAMATHSSTLAWKIPWTEEPGRLQSMGS